jgi:hypothetical protein
VKEDFVIIVRGFKVMLVICKREKGGEEQKEEE